MQVLEKECKRLNDCRVIVQKDEDGLAGARNIAIKECNTELIWFYDVDDYALPSFIEEMVEIQKTNNADIVFCNYFKGKIKKVANPSDKEYSVQRLSKEYVLEHFTDFPSYSWSRIQKMSLFDSGDNYFTPYKSIEDIDQALRSVMAADIIYQYDKPLYVYNRCGGSASSRNRTYDAEAIESIARVCINLVSERYPDSSEVFNKLMLERLMRQMAFSPYNMFKRTYRGSIAHDLIRKQEKPTVEMRVFEMSGFAYYSLIYVFTHYFWD